MVWVARIIKQWKFVYKLSSGRYIGFPVPRQVDEEKPMMRSRPRRETSDSLGHIGLSSACMHLYRAQPMFADRLDI
jgi:hypothetical protein